MRLFLITGMFFLSSLSNFASAGGVFKKVALDIYLADEVAYRTSHAYYMQDVFARFLPGIEYRQVIVPNSSMGLNKEKVRQNIIDQLKTVLHPGDLIQFLILDTHGNTVEADGELETTLAVLGKIGPARVDSDFDGIFSSIKNRTASDLTVILNSCLTFCGPVEASAKRAQVFLNYFSAPNGRIYGAYVKEVDSLYRDPAGFKLRALIPSWKIYLSTTALLAAAVGMSPLLSGHWNSVLMLKDALHGGLYLGLPFATLIETLTPIFSWLTLRTFANRGWLFSFHNGELQDQMEVQKPRDHQLILQRGVQSCQSLFAPGI
jgi:hypothetical protein